MELTTTLVLTSPSTGNLEQSVPIAEHRVAVLSATPAFDTETCNALSSARLKSARAGHFADILGQTLAGPLFATWSPTAAIVATGKPTPSSSSVAALDSNSRRDGRKRSRR